MKIIAHNYRAIITLIMTMTLSRAKNTSNKEILFNYNLLITVALLVKLPLDFLVEYVKD